LSTCSAARSAQPPNQENSHERQEARHRRRRLRRHARRSSGPGARARRRPVLGHDRHAVRGAGAAPVRAGPGLRARAAYRAPTRWDVDGDGIPNRVDRVYNPRWDVDGDGIPNARDRFDNRKRTWR